MKNAILEVLHIIAMLVFLCSLAYVLYTHEQALRLQTKCISTLQDYVIKDLKERIAVETERKGPL